MARRLHLEGAEVLGVYEAKSSPSGLTRNIVQCLNDFNIPLYTSRTVTRVFGYPRLEGVEIARVDAAMRPIAGTEEQISCDGLILSVGLIPENEIAETLGVPMDSATRGPLCDQHYMTMVPGVFSCGNALMVSDLVDYVSEIGEASGKNAARFAAGKPENSNTARIPVRSDTNFLCVVPQCIDPGDGETAATVFFRTREEQGETIVQAWSGEKEVFRRAYSRLRPPEMERITVTLAGGADLRLTMRPSGSMSPAMEDKL
jgi:hypothetical protein